MLLLAKSEDIAVSLSSSIQGGGMLVISYLLWKDNMRFHNILLWIPTWHRVLCKSHHLRDIPHLRFRLLTWNSQGQQCQTDIAILYATYDFLFVFYSNHNDLAQKPCFSAHMTLIWPFKVTKGQTNYAIRFTTYHFL